MPWRPSICLEFSISHVGFELLQGSGPPPPGLQEPFAWGWRLVTNLREGANLLFIVRPDIPLPNRVYIILRAPPGGVPGWTENYAIYLAAVRGPHSRFHPSVISHGFSSQAEAEAYCTGAQRAWLQLLVQQRR